MVSEESYARGTLLQPEVDISDSIPGLDESIGQ
jgi:hypothetical protein